MWKSVAAWGVARLREPSTYAGLAGIVASMSFLPHAAEIARALPAIGGGIAACLSLLAIVLPERGRR
jgi:hypothetical protein